MKKSKVRYNIRNDVVGDEKVQMWVEYSKVPHASMADVALTKITLFETEEYTKTSREELFNTRLSLHSLKKLAESMNNFVERNA